MRCDNTAEHARQTPRFAQAEHEGHAGHGNHGHAHMIADFRQRFWISLALTAPILALSPFILELLGLRETLWFPGPPM